jgi:hypothetical protein
VGQPGFTPETFLEVFPFTQVIVAFFATAGFAVGVGVATTTGFSASCVNLTRTVGAENVKPLADK